MAVSEPALAGGIITTPTLTPAAGMSTLDIDADGFDDAAIRTVFTTSMVEQPRRINVLRNLATENFSGFIDQKLFGWQPDSHETSASGSRMADIATADLNGDGCPEVLGDTATSGDLLIWKGDCSAGVHFQPILRIGNVKLLADLDCGHFNEDGLPDLVVTNQFEYKVIVMAQHPDASFQPEFVTGHSQLAPFWGDRA
jgi:hypothetical protein